MKRPVILALVLLLMLTMVIWAVSKYIQPILPPGMNADLVLFFVALAAVLGIISDITGIVDKILEKTKAGAYSPSPEQKLRNRDSMLKLVWNTWIEGVLKKSLYNEVMIELGMETKPDAVEHPWDMVLQMPDEKPEELAPGTQMYDVFQRADGKLLILGEPGSGKTTMLLELCRQAILFAQKDPIKPIPVVFNLLSWTPKKTLEAWLVDELRLRYYIPKKIAQAWVEHDELTLLLDGLDEVGADNRPAIIPIINTFIDEHKVPVVVCSRRQEYEQMNDPLKLCGAVLIQPLTKQQVTKYLEKTGPSLAIIHEALQGDTEIQAFVQTPLILSILVLTYKDASQSELEGDKVSNYSRGQLFDTFLFRMFKRRCGKQRFNPEKTRLWLSWLAKKMIEKQLSVFYLEHIQPSWLPNPKKRQKVIVKLVIGLSSGFSFGLILGLCTGLGLWLGSGFYYELKGLLRDFVWFGLFFGICLGAFYGTTVLESDEEPTGNYTWSWQSALAGVKRFWLYILILALLCGFILGKAASSRFGVDWIGTRIIVLTIVLIVGLLGVLFSLVVSGIKATAVETQEPKQSLDSSKHNFFLFVLISGLSIGTFLDLIFVLITGLGTLFSDVMMGYPTSIVIRELLVLLGKTLPFYLTSGLYVGLLLAKQYGGKFLINYIISRFILARSGYLPWNLVGFLEHAKDLIFLRRVGGGYIFIHRMLMEHFATKYDEYYAEAHER